MKALEEGLWQVIQSYGSEHYKIEPGLYRFAWTGMPGSHGNLIKINPRTMKRARDFRPHMIWSGRIRENPHIFRRVLLDEAAD